MVVVLLVLKYTADPEKPNPDDPTPTPAGKLWVMVVEETSERSKLPPAQAIAITSGDVRDYLNNHCDREGSTATWRIFDKDQPVENETKEWQDEFAVLKKESTLPVISIKPGGGLRKSRWSSPQPLPKDTDALLALLKKYGGA